jgi:hypothetical protein
MGNSMDNDPRIEAKKKVLGQLKAMARGKMAEGLKAKFRPAPEPAVAPPADVRPPEVGEAQPLSDEELMELLASGGQ